MMRFGAAAAVLLALLRPAHADPPPPTSEFDIPYEIRLLDDGKVMQISGSYSWALPQTLLAVLASAPDVRTVWLESPGGHLQPAVQVAALLQARGVDTFVGRLCASSCTVAFLAGRHRSLGPEARLGFHRAYAPGFPSAEANTFLKAAYDRYAVPAPFVARILRTPHSEVWYPKLGELRAAKVVNAIASPALVAMAGPPAPRLTDIVRMLPLVSDEAVLRFASDLTDLLTHLQETSPESCWAFTHEAPDDPYAALPAPVADTVSAIQARLAATARQGDGRVPDPEMRRKAMAGLLADVRARGEIESLSGLRLDADRTTFCPSLRALLQAALALPAARRPLTIRAILSGV